MEFGGDGIEIDCAEKGWHTALFMAVKGGYAKVMNVQMEMRAMFVRLLAAVDRVEERKRRGGEGQRGGNCALWF